MKITKTECSYQVTECDLKFGEDITLDGQKLISIPENAKNGDMIRPENRLTELVHNENGILYRLENIPPKMFEFFLHKRRTYKDGTSQWNIGVSPSEDPDKGYVFSSIRGSEDDAKKEFEQIISNFSN